MLQTLFKVYVEKYFAPLVAKITEKINGKKTEEQYLHKTMLKPEYSADLKWGSKTLNTSIVSAEIVSMNSPLPLKTRDSHGSASGDIPKLGLKLAKTESDISDINVMKARGADEKTIATKLFDDVPKCMKAIDVANEIMFLQGLSTGVCMIPDAENGKGVRLNYKYKDENKLESVIKWSDAKSEAIEDIQRVFDKAEADGNTIELVMLSKDGANYIRKSQAGKELFANYEGRDFTASSVLRTPTRQLMLDALGDEFGAKFQIVDSTFRIEQKSGNRISIKPFAVENVVFLPDATTVGRLVYGDLAEKTNPVAGVAYQNGSNGMLVSKYSKNDPLEEYTSAQALNVPVLDETEAIYLLTTNVGDAPAETSDNGGAPVAPISEGASQSPAGSSDNGGAIDVNAETSANIKKALTAIGKGVPSNATLDAVIVAVNSLTAAEYEMFEEEYQALN